MNAEYKISRSKIDMFIECPRCFFLDVVKGVKRPSIPGYTLNTAVDELLKKEFDILRKEGKSHYLMDKYGIEAVPFQHKDLDEWRTNFTGVRFKHSSGLILFGAVDDLWINKNDEIHVVDYKSTSTTEEVTLDGPYKEGYKRQIEIYQYLLQNLNLNVSKLGYFVYANAIKTPEKFDEKLVFEMKILTYEGDNSWVEGTIKKINETLNSEEIPLPNENCKYCSYIHNYNNSLNIQPRLF